MNAPSARGLFRATGKTAKDELAREPDDFYPTPPEPTRAFLHAELDRLKKYSSIWEPAAGNGAMVREMEAVGLSVFASDLVDRGCGAIRDFYSFNKINCPCDAIVTNPPYSECGWGNGKAQWLKHALERLEVDYMALLLNWSWPGAGGLGQFYNQYPPARVYLMRWKIDFTGQGAPPMLNGWFVWDREWKGETVLRMLDRTDARQGEFAL